MPRRWYIGAEGGGLAEVEIREFQNLIADVYLEKDGGRGWAGTFVWLTEELGELARSLRKGDMDGAQEEFGDVLAWLVSLASVVGIDMEEATHKYLNGCPKCGHTPCRCRGFTMNNQGRPVTLR